MELEKVVMDDDSLIVRLRGELDHHWAGYLREEIDRLLDSRLPRRLILNLEGLTFMDSAGVGVLLGRYRRLSEQGGEIALCRVPKTVLKVLEISGVTNIISLYQEENDALGKKTRLDSRKRRSQ